MSGHNMKMGKNEKMSDVIKKEMKFYLQAIDHLNDSLKNRLINNIIHCHDYSTPPNRGPLQVQLEGFLRQILVYPTSILHAALWPQH